MPHHLIDVLVGAAAALAVPATAAGITHHATLTRDVAETVEIRTIVLDFPAPGEFLVKGVPAASPVDPVKVSTFRIMRQQVAAATYTLCVADEACDPADGWKVPPELQDEELPGASVFDRLERLASSPHRSM